MVKSSGNSAAPLDPSTLDPYYIDPWGAFTDQLADRVEGLTGDAAAAYEDLEFYSRWCIGAGNREYKENSKFLKRVYYELQHNNEWLLILGPRGSAKSSAVSITYTTWCIGRNPLIRILLSFASKEAQGLAFGRQISTILENNDRYKAIFGSLKPENPVKWNAEEMIVNRPEPPSGIKDPTIGIVGVGSAVPSKRADITICDDVVTMMNASSAVQRESVIRFVYQTLFPILVPGGRRIIIGSCWDPQDLYAYTAKMWGLKIPDPLPLDWEKLREMGLAASQGESITEEAFDLDHNPLAMLERNLNNSTVLVE